MWQTVSAHHTRPDITSPLSVFHEITDDETRQQWRLMLRLNEADLMLYFLDTSTNSAKNEALTRLHKEMENRITDDWAIVSRSTPCEINLCNPSFLVSDKDKISSPGDFTTSPVSVHVKSASNKRNVVLFDLIVVCKVNETLIIEYLTNKFAVEKVYLSTLKYPITRW